MAAEPPYRGRFAPSPTGPLHLGSLAAALASWLFARAAGGRWLVRIEDIDPPREVPGATQLQLAALEAAGLEPDEPPWFQSRRRDAYDAALAALERSGTLYACRCSRSELAPFEGRHPARCVGTDPLRAPSLRVRVGDAAVSFVDAIQGRCSEALAQTVGDFVVRRSDGLAAYQLAVVVDDAAQGITEVVRGADLLDSTPRQVWLQGRLGVATPSYAHVPVVLGPDGCKLSKSLRALPIDADDPLPALGLAYALLGQPVDRLPRRGTPAAWLHRALEHFDPATIPRRASMALPESLADKGFASGPATGTTRSPM